MELNICKKNYNEFNDDLTYFKLNILTDIHKKYLQHMDLNEIIKDYKFSKQKNKKKIIIKRNFVDEERCNARVWRKGSGCRCSKKKIENFDYCKTHIFRKNYGIFK